MAGEILAQNLTGGMGSVIGNTLANLPGMSMLMNIGKAVGIIVIIYVIVLIVQAFMQMHQTLRIKQMAIHVEEINKKMDVLIGKKSKK